MGRSVLYCGGTRSHFMRMVRLMTWSLASLLTGGGVGVGPGIGVDPGVAPAGVVLEKDHQMYGYFQVYYFQWEVVEEPKFHCFLMLPYFYIFDS